jgi:hypothetical protein
LHHKECISLRHANPKNRTNPSYWTAAINGPCASIKSYRVLISQSAYTYFQFKITTQSSKNHNYASFRVSRQPCSALATSNLALQKYPRHLHQFFWRGRCRSCKELRGLYIPILSFLPLLIVCREASITFKFDQS